MIISWWRWDHSFSLSAVVHATPGLSIPVGNRLAADNCHPFPSPLLEFELDAFLTPQLSGKAVANGDSLPWIVPHWHPHSTVYPILYCNHSFCWIDCVSVCLSSILPTWPIYKELTWQLGFCIKIFHFLLPILCTNLVNTVQIMFRNMVQILQCCRGNTPCFSTRCCLEIIEKPKFF